jgi:hypothetical protein
MLVMKAESARRDFLVLWKWEEALQVRGLAVQAAKGTHSGGLNPGDRMFIWAVHEQELYVLGAIRVQRSGRDWAEGQSLYGRFDIIPLKGMKWRLRFQHTKSNRLSTRTGLAMQVRARRCPTPKTVQILEDMLAKRAAKIDDFEKEIAVREGEYKLVTLSERERSRKFRVHLLASRGCVCQICGFDFATRYGEFAKNCVEIHHLELLSSSRPEGKTTTLARISHEHVLI